METISRIEMRNRNKKMLLLNRAVPYLVLSILLFLVSCGGDKEEGGLKFRGDTDATPHRGVFGIVNTIVDSPLITVAYRTTSTFVGDKGVAQLSYAEATRFPIVSSEYDVVVSYAAPGGEAVILLEYTEDNGNPIEVTIDDERILVLSGTLEEPVGYIIEAVEYQNGLDVPRDGTFVVTDPEVHFTHAVASHAQSSFDFYLTQGEVNLSTVEPAATLAYTESSPVVPVLPGGDNRIYVTPNGDPTTILYDSGEFVLTTNLRILFIASQYFGPGGSGIRMHGIDQQALTFINEDLPASWRVANFIGDVSEIDVFVGDTTNDPVLSGIGSGEFSEFIVQEESSLPFLVTPSNFPDDVLFQRNLFLEPGRTVSLFVAGFESNEAMDNVRAIVAFSAIEETRPVSAVNQIRLIHGAPSGEPMNVYLLVPGQTVANSEPIFPNAALGSVPMVSFAPGDYDLVAISIANVSEIFGPSRIKLQPKVNYTLLFSDAPGGGLPVDMSLLEAPTN